MKADTTLDYAFFQLDPSRSRCELWISGGGTTEKLATGSFKPFLSQLRIAQEQNAKGESSVSLQVPSVAAEGSNTSALWFSKATLQRFVRFVSTPEILEHLSVLDGEFTQLEEAISILAANSIRDNGQVAEQVCVSGKGGFASSREQIFAGQNPALNLNPDYLNNSMCLLDGFKGSEHTNGNSKKPLLRVMDSCQFMLLKELQKTYTQAVAAGFDEESMPDMLIFADTFGATRLRYACLNFMALSKKRKLYGSSTLSQNESTRPADLGTKIALDNEHDNLKYPANQHIAIDTCNEELLFSEHAHNSDLAHLKMAGRSSTPAIPRAFYQPESAISQPLYVLMNNHKNSIGVDHWDNNNQTNLLQKEILAHGDVMGSMQSGKNKVDPTMEETVHTLNIKRHSSGIVVDSTTIPSAFSGSLLIQTVNNVTSGAPRSASHFSAPEHPQTKEKLSIQNSSPENPVLVDKEISGPTDSFMLTPLVRRSTSPRQRSSSPLRQVHISRSPARRPIVVVKTLAYSSPSSHDHSNVHKNRHPARTSEDMSTGDSTDSVTESEEESNTQKARNRRLSVQAAISLFESRQKDSFSVQKKKLGYHDALKSSVESSKTVSSRKSVLRRWSGANDASVENGQLNSDLIPVHNLHLAEEKVQAKNQKVKTEENGERFGTSTCHQSEVFLQPHGIELLKQLRYESSAQLLARDMSTPQMQTAINSPRSDLKSSEYLNAVLDLPEQEIQNDHMLYKMRSRVVCLKQSDVSVERQNSEVHPFSGLQAAANYPNKEDRIPETLGSKVVVDYDRNLAVEQNYFQGHDLAPSETSTLFPGGDVVTSSTVELINQAEVWATTGEHESSSDWKASIDLQPEMQSYQLVSEVKGSEERNQGLVTGDPFIMSERHTGKGSLSRSWSVSSDYGMLSLLDVADSKLSQNSTELPTKENNSFGDDQKGRFYEQYREIRDAKFRQESGNKRVERESKLKAMQEVLEKRKAELAERSVRQAVDKQSQSEGQCHHEKNYLPRTSLINESESGETPRWEDHKQQQRVQVALGTPTTAMIMQSAASTPKSLRQQSSNPRLSVVRKLSPSSQKSFTTSTTPRSTARSLASSSPKSVTKNSTIVTSTGQHSSSNRNDSCILDKTLYRSVLSYPEPRKENTKPLSGKIEPLTQQDKVLSSRGTKPKANTSSIRHKHNTVLPLESMSSNSSLHGEKKYEALAIRKSMSTVSDLKFMQGSSKEENNLSPLKVLVRDLALEPSPQSKAHKASMASTVALEVKPFLRKGRGIGPGAGPGVLKMKASLAAEATKANDDDLSSMMDGNGSDGPETLASSTSTESQADQNKLESVIKNEEEATTAVDESVVHVPLPASISNNEQSQKSSNAEGIFQKEENASDEICKNVTLSECQHLTLDASLASHSESQPFIGPVAASQREPSDNSNIGDPSCPLRLPLLSPKLTLQQHMSISKDYTIHASASDMSSSHKLSPEHRTRRLSGDLSSPPVGPASRGFPQLRYSLSPNVDSAKAEAVQSRKRWGNTHKLSVTNTQPASKEAPRGFKRLLKFGRKSRNSANSNTEWISVSTTSGEDDADEGKDLTSKSSEDTIRTASSSINLPRSADNACKVSETECLTGSASRSFFSLSAFRKQRP